MKQVFKGILFIAVICSPRAAMAYNTIWQQVDVKNVPSKGERSLNPKSYNVYSLNTAYLHDFMFKLSSNPNDAQIIELPVPDGSYREFRVWETPMMEPELAAKYPDIKTFTAEVVGDARVTAKLDFTVFGFHAMIFDGMNTYLIDPYSRVNDGYYICRYKHDEYRALNERMVCEVGNNKTLELEQGAPVQLDYNPFKTQLKTVNGYTLRSYRLALACNHFYANAIAYPNAPTKMPVFAQMTTTINRVNGVYERELSITMVYVSKEDTLIFLSAGADPYTNNTTSMLSTNKTICDSLIGTANYDIGHVFGSLGGGIAIGGCVCGSLKAEGATGLNQPKGDAFDIDFVAHEMGHQYGAEHTFNNNSDGSCGGGNAVASAAYEPGSGSTIMAYAGYCNFDNIQPHSDAYFHAYSLQQIVTYTSIGNGNSCPAKTNTSNKVAGLDTFSKIYSIPYKTPFELTAPTAMDSVANTSTTYCWEESDKGSFGSRLVNTYFAGPTFRSFAPVNNTTRVFPKISMVLSGVLSDAGIDNAEGEKTPDTARFLTFKLTMRSIFQGYGCILFPDDTIHLDAINTGDGFKVTSQGATGVNYTGGTTQTVTWNIVGTDAAPISCDSVDIYFSPNGGYIWNQYVGRFPNTGTADVVVPNFPTISSARIKVKGSNNVFFNVNGENFTITNNPVLPTVPTSVPQPTTKNDMGLILYPVPTNDILGISTNIDKELQIRVYNSIGQTMIRTVINKKSDIHVNNWAKGIYYVQLIDAENGQNVVRPVVVN